MVIERGELNEFSGFREGLGPDLGLKVPYSGNVRFKSFFSNISLKLFLEDLCATLSKI